MAVGLDLAVVLIWNGNRLQHVGGTRTRKLPKLISVYEYDTAKFSRQQGEGVESH